MDYEANSLPLSYLTRWWIGIKVAYIKSWIVCLQINQVYAIVTKWQIVNNFEQMMCKNSSNINISFHRCLFDKNVARKLQQERIPDVLKNISVGKWENFVTSGYYYWNSTKLVVSINSHILLCMSCCYTCEKSYISVQWLFVKTLRSKKRSLRSEKSKLDKTLTG